MFHFKIDIFKNTMACRIEKLPTPALESAGYQYEKQREFYSILVLP